LSLVMRAEAVVAVVVDWAVVVWVVEVLVTSSPEQQSTT
jgi:hypothetical protein